jgi:hypothetical protein
MDIAQIALLIGVIIIWILSIVLSWYKFRPNYDSYKNTLLFRPFVKFWRIDTEEKWRLAMSIVTGVMILVALLVAIIALLGGFNN